MLNKGFIHLHLHSQFSLLDGMIRSDDLLRRCKQLGMGSVAVTDHGNLFSAIEFYTKAMASQIKPLLGIEAYVAPGSRFDKRKSGISDAAYHLVLLAENNTGYQNLLKLASVGYTEGFYYRPRIDKEILADLNRGLICTSACLKGEIARLLDKGDEKAAITVAETYAKIFGPDRFFIEVQSHEDDDTGICQALIDLASKTGLPLVATNDVHFLDEKDYEAHNFLCCIGTRKRADDPGRMIYPQDVFLKSAEQMREQFKDFAEACDNTLAIAQRCNVELDLKTRHMPVFRTGDGSSPEEFLKRLAYENAGKLYGKLTSEISKRIEKELEVITSKGFAGYFPINWNLCKWARENNIPAAARGSAVGTVIGYCLGLSNIDPIKYRLLFERFMDPKRDQMPDIDLDICQANRQRLIDYVRQKYWHVAHIITFGTMGARAVVRDICRVQGVPLAAANRLARLIPDSAGMTLDAALEADPDLKQSYEMNERTKEVIDIGKKLEGLARHASVHAAGVLVADKPLINLVPLFRASGSDEIITQYDGAAVEKIGLLKMDLLGLKTLSVLKRACQLVGDIHKVDIDLEKIDTSEREVFELFCSGKTKGVFQFESSGMQDLLMRMKPDRFDDLIAANALYRPGPVVLVDDYIDRKHGAEWSLPHPVMAEILEETHGIMLYQEQVMHICNRLGDIPLQQAYALIKAIGKKDAKGIGQTKQKFITGCITNGLIQKQAEEVFELIERFAGYGFNKSHATRYAFIAYQTAYMKTYWPVEYMAALLTYEMSNTSKVVGHIAECKDKGIEVLAPDINESDVDFTPLYDREKGAVIRFGLGAIKGVGEKAAKQIIAARNRIESFQDLFHFCENVDLRAVNKQVIKALVKAGAFDSLGNNRAQMAAGIKNAMKNGSAAAADRQKGQLNLFGQISNGDYSKDYEHLPDVPPWSEDQMSAYEKEVLGFYLTSNPLTRCADTINNYSTHNTLHLERCDQNQTVVIGGVITNIRSYLTKKGPNAGGKMAVFMLEDLRGQIEVVVFVDILEKYSDYVVKDSVVFVKGKVDRRKEKANIFADELATFESFGINADDENIVTSDIRVSGK